MIRTVALHNRVPGPHTQPYQGGGYDQADAVFSGCGLPGRELVSENDEVATGGIPAARRIQIEELKRRAGLEGVREID